MRPSLFTIAATKTNVIRLARFKKHGISFALSLAVVLLMLLNASNVLPLRFIDRLENFSYDLRLNLMMPRTIDERIVIVDIDEKSLKEQGRWPWPRDVLATLMDQLFDRYQINTLGFDVVFAEKDESSGLKNLEWMQQLYLKDDVNFAEALKKIKPSLDYDQIFANSIKNRKVVLGYYFQTSGDNIHVGQLPQEIFSANNFQQQDIGAVEASGYGANLAVLQKNALSAGHFNPDPDIDGITRKISVLIKYGDRYYEALSTAVARAYLQNSAMQAEFGGDSLDEGYSELEAFHLAGKRIPVDANVGMLVPYRGVQGSFNYVSASDVLNNKVPLKSLKNKIVLVGTTAPGLMDLRATPVQSNYAGVEVHANIISGILDNNIKERPAYTLGAEFLLLLLAKLMPNTTAKTAKVISVALSGLSLGKLNVSNKPANNSNKNSAPKV